MRWNLARSSSPYYTRLSSSSTTSLDGYDAEPKPRFSFGLSGVLLIALELVVGVLAVTGGALLVQLWTGSLHHRARYTLEQIQAAGWNRPHLSVDWSTSHSADSLRHATHHGTGKLHVHNLSGTVASPPRTPSSGMNLLILTPLHDAELNLPRFFGILDSLHHPRINTSLGFLVSDSTDRTGAVLLDHVEQRRRHYKEISVINLDFNVELPGGKHRHTASGQNYRRTILGKARTALLLSTLRVGTEWVLWLDSDVVGVSPDLVEDLLYYGNTAGPDEPLFDIVTPNVMTWHKGKAHPYDLNNWVETATSLRKKALLDDDVLLVEGSNDLARTHLTDLYIKPNVTLPTPVSYLSPEEALRESAARENNLYDPLSKAYIGERVELDGVGGVATLVRADAHRFGAVFPGWLVDHQLETEGFAGKT